MFDYRALYEIQLQVSVDFLRVVQLCYERPLVTTDLVEWLNSFSRKASNHHRGFESQKLAKYLDVLLFVRNFVSHESFMYMIHVNAHNLFHLTPRSSKQHIGTAKVRGKAHWANEIAVEEHEHMVMKLASDSDSSSDTDSLWPGAYKMSLYWILIYG